MFMYEGVEVSAQSDRTGKLTPSDVAGTPHIYIQSDLSALL